MVKFQSRPLLVAVASAYLSGYGDAFSFDMSAYMKIKAMSNQFSDDYIQGSQSNALMKVAGFSDMELFMSKQITADELKNSLKQEYKDRIISEIMSGGGIDISNPLWRRKFFKDKTDAELFTESMPEPMRTIVRLTKDDIPELKEYGQELLKQVQYKKFNKQGNIMSENMDVILMSKDKSATIKDLLKKQMLNQIADPLDRAMMYNIQQQQQTADSVEKTKLRNDLKDLQTIKLFQGSVPEVSPVNSDDLYSFYSLTNNQLDETEILNAALGEDLAGISELDFERYFGTSAKQFSCRTHPSRLRVPCGVNAGADECLASGCCFQPSEDKKTPSCYHDLYGKIGSGMLRSAFIDGDDEKKAKITNLFRNGKVPTLTGLLKEDYSKFIPEEEEPFPTKNADQANWWDAAKVTGENGQEANIPFNNEPRQRFGRPGFQWKPHGPTASPYLDRFPGVNPTAVPAEGTGLDSYYQMWLEYTDTQDQAECALIAPEARVKCMENYDALKDHKQNQGKQCKEAGCCFNEESFLKGQHACYRASDYGTCSNLPSAFVKKECGYDGVSETECLTNARCCYKPTHVAGEPWCFYKYSATLEEDEWCDAWNLMENRQKTRKPCWSNQTGKENLFNGDANTMSNINNLVSRDQCVEAGCCYDEELTADALDWIVEGLGQETHKFRCFEKSNPALIASPAGDKSGYFEINRSKNGDGEDLKSQDAYLEEISVVKTCDVMKWEDSSAFKQSCGENLSYYQCVYVNKCCYKATLTNEPNCFKPEVKAGAQ